MEFLDYLIKTFGYGEPIMMEEISFNGYSRPWISKELASLCEKKLIIRFEKGVYYIPKNTMLGPSALDPNKVIEKKYIANNNEQRGYYSGITFLNLIGLSTQVPNTLEIYTNNETSKKREIKIGHQKVILRKSRTTINNSNVAILSFMELMNFISPRYLTRERTEILKEYIKQNGITKEDIVNYASVFPDNALRTLIESGMIYSVA